MDWTYQSRSREDTFELGRLIGEYAIAGDLILLEGELGSGKTVMVKGIADGLGITGNVSSPSFLILREHESGRLPLFHIDLYRGGASSLADLGWEELLGTGVMAVEWPDLAPGAFPHNCLRVRFETRSDDFRLLSFSPEGERHTTLLERIRNHEDTRN